MSHDFEQTVIGYLGAIVQQLAHIHSATEHTYLAVVAGLDDNQRNHLRLMIGRQLAEMEVEQFRDDLDDLPTTDQEEN